jgi:hypothetical protein
MEPKEALLDSLAELRVSHDKASRLMAEIAAVAASALKGGDSLPSLTQLRRYEQALAHAQRHSSHCQELLLSSSARGRAGEAAGILPVVH